MAEKKLRYPNKSGNGKNSPVIGDNGVHTKPGDNSRIAAILLEVLRWGTVDKSNVAEMEKRFIKYVDFCMKNDVRITNQLTYLALGINKDIVYEWTVGGQRTKEHADFIKKITHFCSSYREQLGADGKLNPVTLIWWQKNYDGFVDKSEIVLTPKNPLGELKDPLEIQKRLSSGVVED